MGVQVTFHDRVGRERLAEAAAPLSVDQLHALLESALAESLAAALGDREVEVELTLCGDEQMIHLNFDHMGERGPTDVLAFPLHEWEVEAGRSHLGDDEAIGPPGAMLLGDVVIDVDQAARQAAGNSGGLVEELALLAIHGALHLVGHDHAEFDEQEQMRAVEHRVLQTLHRRHRDVHWHLDSVFDQAPDTVTAGR